MSKPVILDQNVSYISDCEKWRAFFAHEKEFYVADLVSLSGKPELMIFPADYMGRIVSYDTVYEARPEKADRETLIQHIQTFAAEMENIKTLKGWHEFAVTNKRNDWHDYCKPGDEIDEEAYDYFLDILPPRTMKRGYFQVGEPYDIVKNETGVFEETYSTFCRRRDGARVRYFYLGNCFAGKDKNIA